MRDETTSSRAKESELASSHVQRVRPSLGAFQVARGLMTRRA